MPNEVCCLTTGRCFDPVASPAECTISGRPTVRDAGALADAVAAADGSSSDAAASPAVAVPGEPPTPGAGTQCASDRDCNDDEYCTASFCLGPGLCISRTNCGTCVTSGGISRDQPPPDPPPGTECQVCGCDGVTYVAPQAACRAGVRVAGNGACGAPATVRSGEDAGVSMRPRVYCGNDAQCGPGQLCCAILGVCFDATCTTCCRYPPPGTRFPCRDNADCVPTVEYCEGTGCGTPGGCTPLRSGCGGVVEMVCGCDGRTYTNACWAAAAGTRVASPGACR